METITDLLANGCHECGGVLSAENMSEAVVRYCLVPAPGELPNWSAGSTVFLCAACTKAEQEKEERRKDGTHLQDR